MPALVSRGPAILKVLTFHFVRDLAGRQLHPVTASADVDSNDACETSVTVKTRGAHGTFLLTHL
jgi:hypothetical protein